jgi:hypothetical protein
MSPRDHQRNSDDDDVIETISLLIDRNLFNGLLARKIGPVEATLIDKIEVTPYYKKLNKSLRLIKVTSFLAGICTAGISLGQGLCGNNGLTIAFGAAAVDMLRISFNAHTKHYIILLMRRMGSSENIVNNITAWAKNSLGISAGAADADPLAALNSEVKSEILLSQTIFQKVMQNFYEANKL